MSSNVEVYRPLPLIARLGVALRCGESFCAVKNLQGPELTAFFGHMWELPCCASFPDWDSQKGELVFFGLGDELPLALGPVLPQADVSETSFRDLISAIVEIVYSSAWAAYDELGSFQFLKEVLSITAQAGVPAPPCQPFLISSSAKQFSWGNRISKEQRDAWRYEIWDQQAGLNSQNRDSAGIFEI